MQGSGKFHAELELRQRKMEQLLIENRVKKLKNEEERLCKQIKIANKHSEMADGARMRREEDARLRANAMQAELDRIEK